MPEQIELRVSNCVVLLSGWNYEDIKKKWRKIKPMLDIWLDENKK